MTIKEIYSRYPVPMNLRKHMTRVAAVNQYVGEHLKSEIDVDLLVEVGLSHDLGNLIKYKLDLFPDLIEEPIDELKVQREEMIKKYGENEHEATMVMAKEIGFGDEVLAVLKVMGFRYFEEILDGDDFVRKICEYGDLRVMPRGIVSIDERFEDLRVRYSHRGQDFLDQRYEMSVELEKQLQEQVDIDLSEINGMLLEERVERLWNWEISLI